MIVRSILPPETEVLFRPAAVYRRLSAGPGDPTWLAALRAPAFVALLVGSVLALTTAGRFTLRLMIGGAAAWSFVPAVQILVVIALCAGFGVRRLPASRAVDLYFVGHAPWSLWLLTIAGIAAFLPPSASALWAVRPGPILVLSVLIPLVWSKRILWAFFADALELDRRRAWVALAIHDAVVWGSVVGFFFLTDQLWPRLAVLPGFVE